MKVCVMLQLGRTLLGEREDKGCPQVVVTECEDHESLVRPVDIESPRVIIIIQVSENV